MNAVTRRTGTHDSNRSAPMSRLEAINTASVAMRYAIDLMEIVTIPFWPLWAVGVFMAAGVRKDPAC